jgi:hypothetical protein
MAFWARGYLQSYGISHKLDTIRRCLANLIFYLFKKIRKCRSYRQSSSCAKFFAFLAFQKALEYRYLRSKIALGREKSGVPHNACSQPKKNSKIRKPEKETQGTSRDAPQHKFESVKASIFLLHHQHGLCQEAIKPR